MFIVAAMMIGVVTALMAVVIFGAIAIPAYDSYVLTHLEKADMDLIASRFSPIAEQSDYILWPLVPLLIIAFGLFLSAMNPRLGKGTIRLRPGLYKAIVVVFAVVLVSVLYLMLINSKSGLMALLGSSVLMGCLWMVIGDMGWAGDFSSWRSGTAERGPKFLKCFAYGATVGAVMVGLMSWTALAINRYFILVSEVLDGSGEMSSRGYELFFYGMLVLFVLNAGILASFALSLSPSVKARDERIKNLAICFALAGVFFVATYGTYSNAADKYDLDINNLAEAVGIPADTTDTVRLLQLASLGEEGRYRLADMTLEVFGFTFAGSSKIAVSRENINRVEEYLQSHPDGTVHKYSALDSIYKGYFSLLDVAAADEALMAAADEMIYPRLLLMQRLSVLPVTPSNISMARRFADEDQWFIKGRAAFRLAEAFAHFGLIDEARKWEDRAIADGFEVNQSVVPTGDALTDGAISGRLRLNGAPLTRGRVALMSLFEEADDFSFSHITRGLVAVSGLDANGGFSFESLGSGRYYMLFIDDSSLLEGDIKSTRVNVSHNADVVVLDASNARKALGAINIHLETSDDGSAEAG